MIYTRYVLLITILFASCNFEGNDSCSLSKYKLLQNGYKQWLELNIYHKKVGDIVVFMTLNEKQSVEEKYFYLELKSLDPKTWKENYIELSQTDNDSLDYVYSLNSNMLYKIDTTSGYISLTQMDKSCFDLSENI